MPQQSSGDIVKKFTPGQTVDIRCDVQRGAFPTEWLITIQTLEGPVSGFVRSDLVHRIEGHEGFIRAIIHDVSSDTVTVLLQGSFFTTTGLAYLNREWAKEHIEPAYA